MSIAAIFLGLLPGAAWLFFYLKEDPHPEPKPLIALAFVNGAAFTFLALGAQLILDGVLRGFGIVALSFFSLFLFAGIEEVFKFLAAYFAVHRSSAFDEPVDAMIYAIVASLGFATVENIGILSDPSDGSLLVASAFQIITFRFVGATLLHALASGIVGYYWADSIRKFGYKRPLVFGLLIATVIHAIFNFLILSYGGGAFASVIFLLLIGFFVLSKFEVLKRRIV